jgi:hypothetical protein
MANDHRDIHHHPIVFSLADFSFWCYECESYVVHKLLNHNQSHFYAQKFPKEISIEEAL